MCTLYVMIGVSGSGKSTFAKKFAAERRAEYVSTDELRKMMYGDEAEQKGGRQVFDVAYMNIAAHLNHRRSVVFDATNTTTKGRDRLIKVAKECKSLESLVAILCNPPLETCLKQNKMRERQVPENVIRRQHEQLLRDGESIPKQFDKVVFVRC